MAPAKRHGRQHRRAFLVDIFTASYRMVSRYRPVLASTKIEKLLVPTDSPQITRQVVSGNLVLASSRKLTGLPGFFLSYSAPFFMAVLYASSESTLTEAMRNGLDVREGPDQL